MAEVAASTSSRLDRGCNRPSYFFHSALSQCSQFKGHIGILTESWAGLASLGCQLRS